MKNSTIKQLKTFLLIALLYIVTGNAQDKGYVHTVAADNVSGHITYLDHPDLNGNPGARFLFSQRSDDGYTVNNNPTGIWYDGNRWTIYNETFATMPVGIQFNIFIPDDSPVTVHVATASNIFGHETEMSGYVEGDYLFYNNYFNPNSVYNPNTYGNYWWSSKRILYEESLVPVPEGAAFMVMSGFNVSSTRFSQTSNSSNVVGSSMQIDHPLLNGNPNAVFLFSHYWGYPDGSNTTYLPHVTDTYYSGGYWRIFAYDEVPFPENVWFDFIVPDEIMGTEEITNKFDKITLYPNPSSEIVNFNSKTEINEIAIYDVSGKLLLNSKTSGTNIQINISALPQGIYLAKIKTDKGWDSQKLIKK